jgi:hypothetical protein
MGSSNVHTVGAEGLTNLYHLATSLMEGSDQHTLYAAARCVTLFFARPNKPALAYNDLFRTRMLEPELHILPLFLQLPFGPQDNLDILHRIINSSDTWALSPANKENIISLGTALRDIVILDPTDMTRVARSIADRNTGELLFNLTTPFSHIPHKISGVRLNPYTYGQYAAIIAGTYGFADQTDRFNFLIRAITTTISLQRQCHQSHGATWPQDLYYLWPPILRLTLLAELPLYSRLKPSLATLLYIAAVDPTHPSNSRIAIGHMENFFRTTLKSHLTTTSQHQQAALSPDAMVDIPDLFMAGNMEEFLLPQAQAALQLPEPIFSCIQPATVEPWLYPSEPAPPPAYLYLVTLLTKVDLHTNTALQWALSMEILHMISFIHAVLRSFQPLGRTAHTAPSIAEFNEGTINRISNLPYISPRSMRAIHTHLQFSAGSPEAVSDLLTKAALQGILLNPNLMQLVSVSDLLDLCASFTAGYFTLPTLIKAAPAVQSSRRIGRGLGLGTSSEEDPPGPTAQLPTSLPPTRANTVFRTEPISTAPAPADAATITAPTPAATIPTPAPLPSPNLSVGANLQELASIIIV